MCHLINKRYKLNFDMMQINHYETNKYKHTKVFIQICERLKKISSEFINLNAVFRDVT